MPTLAKLKAKWFIDEYTEPDLTFRYPGTGVSHSTDNNLVTVLGEGDAYMAEWNNLLSQAHLQTHVYNVNWQIDNVLTLGNNYPDSGALDVLKRAKDNGALVYQLTCTNKMALSINLEGMVTLARRNISLMIDSRYPAAGSNHQKFMVYKDSTRYSAAMLGSIDINNGRYDTQAHNSSSPTHDFGVKVEGPAVRDIEWTFLERWNDSSRGIPNTSGPPQSVIPGLEVPLPPPPITPWEGDYSPAGTHSVQVLRTYGLQSWGSYSWAQTTGEFSVWAATLNAVKKAEHYIYIEDQTFFTFHWPPCCDQYKKQAAQETDIIYQLGEAIKEGVKVGILAACRRERRYL